MMSGKGLKSDGMDDMQSEAQSYKSLIKSKGAMGGPMDSFQDDGLKEAMKQNQKKVKGTTSIKNLIRSAATRHWDKCVC